MSEEIPPGVVAVHYFDTETSEIRASSNQDFIGVNAAEQGAPSLRTRRSSTAPTTRT